MSGPVWHRPATGLPENLGLCNEEGWQPADTSAWQLSAGADGEEAKVAASRCSEGGVQTLRAGVAEPGAAINSPEDDEGLSNIAAAVLSPEASTN